MPKPRYDFLFFHQYSNQIREIFSYNTRDVRAIKSTLTKSITIFTFHRKTTLPSSLAIYNSTVTKIDTNQFYTPASVPKNRSNFSLNDATTSTRIFFPANRFAIISENSSRRSRVKITIVLEVPNREFTDEEQREQQFFSSRPHFTERRQRRNLAVEYLRASLYPSG